MKVLLDVMNFYVAFCGNYAQAFINFFTFFAEFLSQKTVACNHASSACHWLRLYYSLYEHDVLAQWLRSAKLDGWNRNFLHCIQAVHYESESKKEIINRGILIIIVYVHGRDIDVSCLNHRNNRVRNIN